MKTNPFVGLNPFSISHQSLFYGRAKECDQLFRLIDGNRFILLTGKAGSGKTSFLQAGLIPSLSHKKNTLKQTNWRIVYFRPGTQPLQNLLQSILNNIGFRLKENVPFFTHLLERKKFHLFADFVNRWLGLQENRFLIIIDNFEELLIHSIDSEERASKEIQHFFNLLKFLFQNSNLHVHLLVSVRSDFLEEFYSLEGALPVHSFFNFVLPNLPEEKLRECIVQPLKKNQVEIDPELVTQIIKDLRFVPYPLPRLRYGLIRLWDEWRLEANDSISLNDYQLIAPIHNLISRDGDEILRKLEPPGQTIAARVFKALIAVDKKERLVSHPRTLSELKIITEDSNDDLEKIIDLFYSGGKPFLDIQTDPLSGELLIEIAHECLPELWGTYRQWVNKELNAYQIYYQYIQPAMENTAEFLSPSRNEQHRIKKWFSEYSTIQHKLKLREIDLESIKTRLLGKFSRSFLSGSRTFLTENGNLAHKKVFWATLIFMFILATIIFFIYKPLTQFSSTKPFMDAGTKFVQANIKPPENSTSGNTCADTISSLQLNFKPAAPEAPSNIYDFKKLTTIKSNQESPGVSHIPSANSDTLKSGSELVTKNSANNRIQQLWQLGEQALTNRDWLIAAHIFAYIANQPISEKQKNQSYKNIYQSLYTAFLAAQFQLPYLPQGIGIANKKPYAAIWNITNTFQVWNYLSGQQISPNFNFGAPIWEIKFAPNDRSFVVWGEAKFLQLFTFLYGRYRSRKLIHSNFIASIVFSPDGSYLLSSDISGKIKIWSAETGIPVTGTFSQGEPIQKILFSPDGQYFIALTFKGKVYLWELQNSRSPVKILGSESDLKKYEGIALSKTRNHFVAWTNWEVEIRDFNTGRLIKNPYLSTYGLIGGVKMSPDLTNILVWDRYRYARIWDLQSNRELKPPLLHRSNVVRADYSSNGKRIFTQSSEGKIHIWNISTHKELINPIFIPGGINSVQWINNDRWILTNDNQGNIQLWDAFTGNPVGFSFPHPRKTSIRLTGDQSFLISWGKMGASVNIWYLSDYFRNYTKIFEKSNDKIADLDFPAKYLQLLVEVVTGTTLDNNGNILVLSPQQWEKKKMFYEQIAKNHLSNCKYKNLNFYFYQKRIWDKWKILSSLSSRN